ncbi:MAG: MBL fold metallo-hydrolase [Desulfobacula sp.]|nr:MBL fold metallo-hydrolase [Desulfobacula sp.]
MQNKPLFIQRLNVGPYEVNTYIVSCPETLEGIIIDPGGEDEKVHRVIEDHHIHPRYLINTHGHRDHVQSNVAISTHYDIPVCMHEDDKTFFQDRAASQAPETIKTYDIDRVLHHEDILSVGTLKVKVIHTPGHTPGSVCLSINNCLFSGDTLFVGSAGRADLPGGNFHTLIRSIHQRLVPLPPDTILYPGHDYGSTPVSTIGREIKENIYITDFISPSS